MERFDRLMILLTTLLLPWFEPLPCRAQPPVPAAAPSPPAPPAPDDPTQTLHPPRPTQTSPPAPPPAPDDQAGELKLPPLQGTDLPLPINLAAALRLADARPLIVAAAQASAWVAEAQLQRAKVLWIPTLNLSSIYLRHDGFGPDLNRGLNTPARPLNQNINFFYGGFGLINVSVETTDMIFQPLAARQVLGARRWDIQTAKNDALLGTAKAYFGVHEYRGKYAGALDVVERGAKLVERVTTLSKDLVPKAEVDRTKRLLADLEQKAASAREAWRVASADLTQILRLDPRTVVVPLEHDHLQITLIDPARPLNELIPIGQRNRPEIASQMALIQAAQARIRREKWRPFLPTLYLNGFQTAGMRIQAGIFGLGADSHLNNWSLRNDIAPSLVWQAQGFGLGNLALLKQQRGEQSRLIAALFRIQDAVAAAVTQDQAHLQSAAARVGQTERSLREALITFDKNYDGLKQTRRFENVLVQVYRPQEAVAALEHLAAAYDAYFATVADYNRAQFQMFHALGYPAAELSYQQPPGDAVPVDVQRPPYLPPVGIGPPPATR